MSEIEKRKAAVTPRGINHVVLNVRDMDESHHFWSELLGFRQVGTLRPRPDAPRMQFYSGVTDDVSHHDIALVENPDLPVPDGEWTMFGGASAINHIAITYPDRQSWLEQVQFLMNRGVKVNRRLDHGMTHSIYINDPNGHGVEVLYELPEEVWRHDINGALNHAVNLPAEDALTDNTNYETEFSPK